MIICGLGNPGEKYLMTRHNIGFMVADLLASKWRIKISKKAAGLLYGKGSIDHEPVMLAKPQTFMNLSGKPLRALGIKSLDLMVIHDDLDLPFGTVKIKKGGGPGGHNGLKSIIEELDNDAFIRIRCGIGRPPGFMDPAGFVLENFSTSELEMVSTQIATAADAVRTCLKFGLNKAMNQFNRKERLDQENTQSAMSKEQIKKTD